MGDRKAVFVLFIVLVLFVLPTSYAWPAETNENKELYEFLSSESPSYTKLFRFLSDVVGLDLTKYGIIPPEVVPPGFEGLSTLEYFTQLSENVSTLPPPNITRVDRYGGLVEEMVLSPDFGYNKTRFGTMGIFVNGHMVSLKLYPDSEENYVYSEPQPTDLVGRAKGILQRYQTFFQETYGKDASYLEAMLEMLNSNHDLSIEEFTEGNVTFRFSQDENRSRLEWIYTEDEVEIYPKGLSIKFCDNTFESFHDTWGLYNFSELSTISFEEAAKIVVEAAQNGELYRTYLDPKVGYVNVSELLDTRYSVSILMEAFTFDDYSFPSKISRDPLTIYPLFQIYFYFNERPDRSMGLVIFVWGDTGEIRSCTDVGKGFYYNGPLYDTNDLLLQEPNTTETTHPESIDQLTLGIIATLIAVPVISISVWISKRKNRKVKQNDQDP